MRVLVSTGLAAVLNLVSASVGWADQPPPDGAPVLPALLACVVDTETGLRAAAVQACFEKDAIHQAMDACLWDPGHGTEQDGVTCVKTANKALETVIALTLEHIRAGLKADNPMWDRERLAQAIAQLDRTQQTWSAYSEAEVAFYDTLGGAGGIGRIRIITDREQENLLERISYLSEYVASP